MIKVFNSSINNSSDNNKQINKIHQRSRMDKCILLHYFVYVRTVQVLYLLRLNYDFHGLISIRFCWYTEK